MTKRPRMLEHIKSYVVGVGIILSVGAVLAAFMFVLGAGAGAAVVAIIFLSIGAYCMGDAVRDLLGWKRQ